MKRTLAIDHLKSANNATLTAALTSTEIVRVGTVFRYTLADRPRGLLYVYCGQVTPSLVKYGISNDDASVLVNSMVPISHLPLILHLANRQTFWLHPTIDTTVRLVLVGEES